MASLDGASNIEAAWCETRKVSQDLGAAYIGIKQDFQADDPLFLWTLPEWVTEMYLETVYPDHDPRLAHCRANTTPYFYGREFWLRDDVIPEPRRVYDEEIVGVGMKSMVAIPVHKATGSSFGLVAWAFDMSNAELQRHYSDAGSVIHLVAIAAYERIAALVNGERRARIGLSKRECESLLWLGRGLRYSQIAEKLGVRSGTVEFHLGNARRKLGAKSREQALVRAMQLDIINP